jgi:threonine/homoserine/homoserine lactone efflux protein
MLPDRSHYMLFVAAALVLLVVPGPAVLYIVARSVDQGRRAGLMSVLGVAVGSMFHVTAAALGLSTLLVSSTAAYQSVKYVGAAYLIFLGIQKFVTREEAGESVERATPGALRIFAQGVIANTLNPKTALFFFAFLPQFVNVSRGSVALQILSLGMTFTLLGICSDGSWALLASAAGHKLKQSSTFVRGQRYVTGSVYLGLGLAAAFAGPRHNK